VVDRICDEIPPRHGHALGWFFCPYFSLVLKMKVRRAITNIPNVIKSSKENIAIATTPFPLE